MSASEHKLVAYRRHKLIEIVESGVQPLRTLLVGYEIGYAKRILMRVNVVNSKIPVAFPPLNVIVFSLSVSVFCIE